jgi:UDP-N-acetylmuramate-alanine ligase
VTFGFNAQADVRAVNLTLRERRRAFRHRAAGRGSVIEGCTLPMPGDHNVSNALAAVAVARHLGMKRDEIREALAGFAGVNRRFTKVGEVNGVTIIDDYGHHPVEIAAVLRPRGRRRRAGSSRSTSRTAIPACRACSRISAPASTRPTWSPSPRSMRRARTRSPGPAATIWWRG